MVGGIVVTFFNLLSPLLSSFPPTEPATILSCALRKWVAHSPGWQVLSGVAALSVILLGGNTA